MADQALIVARVLFWICAAGQAMIRTNIPFRLDRLPWSRFHLLVVIGLGITWILDGLEVTIVGSLGPALQSAETLHLSSANLGAVASFYVVGAVVGALVFGWITDRHGRRLVFYVTLIVYLSGVLLSAFAWDFWSFAIFRMITGLGIGGEYAAVNSAIDELIPAKYRGRVDLIVNGSFWLGAAGGALAVPFLLDQRLFAPDIGWRLGFGIGAVLGLGILLLRRFVPESPRWLVTHGQNEQAEKTVSEIEKDVAKATGQHPPAPKESIEVHPKKVFGIGLILSSMIGQYRKRSILALVLMVAQSFLYNSVFFTFGLVLSHFYKVPSERVGLYLLPLAIGNFCGPLLLGSLFDTIGRKAMIAGTFAISGLLLLITAYLFAAGFLTAANADNRLVFDLLLCLGSGEFGLSDRQRDLPARDARLGDRMFLRTGHRHRRKHIAASVRLAHRVGIGLASECRIRIGCRVAPDRRRDGTGAGNRCGRKVPRKHRGSAIQLEPGASIPG